MKLFKLRLTTLKSKLYAIVFASFVVRVVAFFALPNTSSAIGPDEGTYGEAVAWIAFGNASTGFSLYANGLYLSGRSLLLPSVFLSKLGIDSLDAVRLISSLYGFLIICLASTVILKTTKKHPEVRVSSRGKNRVILSLFFVFTFLPSHFVWSILGLRESATEFWVIAVFVSLYLILDLNEKLTFSTAAGYLISIVMVFSARPQVGWVLGVALALYLFFKINKGLARMLIPLTLTGVFLGYTFSLATAIEVNSSFVARQVFPVLTSSVEPTPLATSQAEFKASKFCKFENQRVVVDELEYLCTTKTQRETVVNLKNPGRKLLDQVDAIPYHHEVNKVAAESVIKTQTCPIAGDSRLSVYLCIVYKAPYTTFVFLFRPIIGTDVTSLNSFFAAVENMFWLASAMFIAGMFVRNRKLVFIRALAPSVLFMCIYVIGAGAYEGNLGTAFRHKSLILWVVVLLLGATIHTNQIRKMD